MFFLSRIDINGTTDSEADVVAQYNLDDDADLDRLMKEWIRPDFDENNSITKAHGSAILEASRSWSEDQMKPVFNQVLLASGQRIANIGRFMAALRKELL